MKEKIKSQKGFIQIPLLIAIIASIVVSSTATTGVILYKQGKITSLVANVSRVFQKNKEIKPEIKTEEPKIEEKQSLLEKTNQEQEDSQTEQGSKQADLKSEKTEQKQQEQKQKELEKQPIENTEKQELLFKALKVVDGDTVKLENGEVVRYIGIDAPETVHPSKPVQCFGKEASDKNKELVEGKLVKLEKDITDRDKYGRLLRYVWVGDTFVNDYLVRQGYAYAYTYPPDVEYSNQFVRAQQEARENSRGLWASCQLPPEPISIPTSTPTSSPELTPEPTLTPTSVGGIICSYNTYNCSNFSTHVEAQSVFDYCGGVTNDVHRLDADKDGSACESLP